MNNATGARRSLGFAGGKEHRAGVEGIFSDNGVGFSSNISPGPRVGLTDKARLLLRSSIAKSVEYDTDQWLKNARQQAARRR